MKTLSMSLAAALLVGALTNISANETIDAQIAAIQNADADQRSELMNEFKRELSQMNEQERSEAIAQMREQMQHMNQEQVRTRVNQEAQLKEQQTEPLQEQTRVRTRVMNENEQADQMNYMHQHQYQMNNMAQSGAMPKK